MNKQPAKILVLGIGNILLQDEGIGVRVIEYLQKQFVPEGIELVDGGTAGADLIDVLSDRQAVFIIDAVDYDASPGTILKMTPDNWLSINDNALSLHDLDIPQTLAMTHLMGCAPKTTIIFGIVPKTIVPGMTLSKELATLVPAIAKQVLREISLIQSGKMPAIR